MPRLFVSAMPGCNAHFMNEAKRPKCPLGDTDDWDIETCLSSDLVSDRSSASTASKIDVNDYDRPCEELSKFVFEETLIIFDWDDTILPTTWLMGHGLNLMHSSVASEAQHQELFVLAQWAAETLRMAKKLGTVVIVTNAEDRWVELTCQKFLPSLVDSLAGVKIVSARSTYEPLGIVDRTEWKIHAFEKEVHSFCETLLPDKLANIVSIGDAQHEREALFQATRTRPACRSKSVKFITRPVLEQLVKEHAVFCDDIFRNVVRQDGDVDLFLDAELNFSDECIGRRTNWA